MTKQNPYFTDRIVLTPGDATFTEEEWELQFRGQYENYMAAYNSGFFDEEELEEMLAG